MAHVSPGGEGSSITHEKRILRRGKIKTQVQQIILFGMGDGLARALNWGTMALLPLLLRSSEEYGRVGMLVSIEMLVANISLVGLDRAVLRFYAKDESPGNLLRSVLTIWAALAWIPLATVLMFYLSGRDTLFSIPLVPHLFLLSIIVAVFNLNLLCVCISRVQRHLASFLRFRLCYVALKFICVLVMAKMFGHSLSYVVGVGISALVMVIFIVPFLRGRADGRPDLAVVGRLLMFGWPFLFVVVSGNIFDYFGRFFLEVYSSTKDVGIYTFAFTLGSLLFVVYAALATYFEPRIHSHADDKPRCEKWLAYYTNLCIALGSLGGASLLLFYPHVLSHLPADYADTRPIITIFMGVILLRPIHLQGNYRLMVYQKTHHIALGTFIAAVLNVALNFLLIPWYGIAGAALAMYFASFFLSGYILAVSLHVGRITWRQQPSLVTCAVCAVGALCVVVWTNKPGIAILALLMVCLVGSGFLVRSFLNTGERSR